MTHLIARFGMNLLLCSVATAASAAQSEQPAAPGATPPPRGATHAPLTIVQHGSAGVFQATSQDAPAWAPATEEQEAKGQNRLRFITGEEAEAAAQRMRERLADPQQRLAFRAEQRAAVVSQNVSVGRLVGLDPVTEQKLIDLLTDQQMARFEQMHTQSRTSPPELQQYADEATQRMNELRALLGEEKLERFQDFEMSQSERYWVNLFSARLAPADKLQPDQEDRLTALKREQIQSSFAAFDSWRAFQRPLSPLKSIEDMQRESQRHSRIANENTWRKRQVENVALAKKAASFLTSTQLAEFVKYQTQEQENVRRYVEAARVEEGLDPKIPAQPEVADEAPKLIEAQLQVEVSLNVNREPTTVMRTIRNGESFTFEAAQGLIVEATPTMYEDDWVDVHLKYYENSPTGRRRLSGGSITTAHVRQPDGSLATGGSGGTVISGRKGYAVEATINTKVL